MKERAVSFGENNNLLGVLSTPNVKINDLPAVIILNSGLLHKVGPFRLNTELSRKIAENGFNVLRFDLSGIGDSKISLKEGSRWEKAIRDTRHAMNFIYEICGSKEFVLIGLCSGSDNAHRISLTEKRVIGAVHLDGYSYRNLLYYVKYYGGRMICGRLLFKRFKKIIALINFWKNNENISPNTPVMAYLDREFPDKKKAIKDFKLLVSRGVKLLYVFTGGVQDYNNYKDQLRDSLHEVNFKNFLDLEYFPYAQHTYSTVNSRKKVINKVFNWLDTNFGLSNSLKKTTP